MKKTGATAALPFRHREALGRGFCARLAFNQHSIGAMPTAAAALLKKLSPPMLATLASQPPADEANWVFELKYDGFRVLAAKAGDSVELWSRNALSLRERFPSVATALEKLAGDAVLDGEVVALDDHGVPRFQLLQRAEATRLHYVVFDLLWLDGRDLRGEPLESRRAFLLKLLARKIKGVSVAGQLEGPAAESLARAANEGQEGIIGKVRGSKYENRRSKTWIKLKAQNNQELVIVGYTPSAHSDQEIGALLLGVFNEGRLRFAGKVGTGFSARLRVGLRELLAPDAVAKATAEGAPRLREATWVKPRYVAQVSFTEWTSDGKLRHPSFLGMREDKSVNEVTREVPQSVEKVVKADKAATPKAKRAVKSDAKSAVKSATKSVAKPVVKPAVKRATAAAIDVPLTSPERILYPKDGITKLDIVDYFQAVSAAMITTLADRPLALEHWNQGIARPSWFHQDAKEVPEWITTIETPTRTRGKSVEHLVVDRPETLRWLAQRSALTLHMWSSRGVSLENPDWVVFDLDPAEGKGIEQAIETALVLRRVFDDMEIPSVPKTSGKRGIHLFVPLAKGHTHEEAAAFAWQLAVAISAQLPDVTTERPLAARKGRLYFDALQNGYGKTIVAPYSLRAIDGAPVSAPLKWSEVSRKLDQLKFNLRSMPKRLDKVGDLFADVRKDGINLKRYKKS